MSYDVYLRGPKCPTCGESPREPDLPDPTYNLSAIFDLALTGEPWPNPDVGEGAVVLLRAKTDRPRGLRVLSGKLAADTAETLRVAIVRLTDPAMRDAFAALEPSNKWGDLTGAIEIMKKLAIAAAEYPTHTWEVH